MVPVIAGAIDPQRKGTSPLWHILEPDGKPFCRANISGQVTTSKKGTPTCGECKRYDYPSIYEAGQKILKRLNEGEAMKATPKRSESYEIYNLESYRLVTIDQANYAVKLTERGRIALMDMETPALWRDGHGLIHGRRPLNDSTCCDVRIGMQYCADIATLHVKAKRQNLAKITCMKCIAWQLKYGAVTS